MHVMPETLYGLLPPAIEPAMATGVLGQKGMKRNSLNLSELAIPGLE
jgi:hypothetical protein